MKDVEKLKELLKKGHRIVSANKVAKQDIEDELGQFSDEPVFDCAFERMLFGS